MIKFIHLLLGPIYYIIFTIPILNASEDPFNITLSAVNHRITIINGGAAALSKRLEIIDSATTSIDIEYLIYRKDLAGQIFTQALIKKAAEGVKIRLILDYFLVKNHINPFIVHELKQLGIIVKFYNTAPTINLYKLQYRNHRKSVIVDNKIAIIGGRNIGNEYFDMDESYNFQDRDVLIKGAIVKYIAQTYQSVWESKPVTTISRPYMPLESNARYGQRSQKHRYASKRKRGLYKRDLKKWKLNIVKAKKFLTLSDKKFNHWKNLLYETARKNSTFDFSGTCNNISFVSDRPKIGKRSRSRPYRVVKYQVYKRLNNLKNSVIIDTPYFIVDNETEDVIYGMIDKNINISVLTNSVYSTDAIYVSSLFNYTVEEWIDDGINFYLALGKNHENYYFLNDKIKNARFGTHSKTVIFDEQDIMIGSYNFDPHSENYNLEMVMFCNNQVDLALKLKNHISHLLNDNYIHIKDMQTAKKARFKNVGLGKIISYYMIKIPARLLDHLL